MKPMYSLPVEIEKILQKTNSGMIGFERMFDEFITRTGGSSNYPPYDVKKVSEDQYEIVLAVAGFTRDDITVQVENGSLVVTGERSRNTQEDSTYLFRGIAQRAFNLKYYLAEFLEVEKVTLENGLLTVFLKKEIPEALKPKVIEIQ